MVRGWVPGCRCRDTINVLLQTVLGRQRDNILFTTYCSPKAEIVFGSGQPRRRGELESCQLVLTITFTFQFSDILGPGILNKD